jgi:hypothetical protein
MSLPHLIRRHAAPNTSLSPAVERYRRAMDRYHANLRMMPERALRRELTELGEPLDDVLHDFQALLDHLQPDKAREAEILSCVHRAATLCAHATEAALMANEAAWRHDQNDIRARREEVQERVTAIGGLAAQVRLAT